MKIRKGTYVLDVHPQCMGEVGVIIDIQKNESKPVVIKWLNTEEYYRRRYNEGHLTFNTYGQFNEGTVTYRFRLITKKEAMIELL